MAQAHATAPNKNVQTDIKEVYSMKELAQQPIDLKEANLIEFDYQASYDSTKYERRYISKENCGWILEGEKTDNIDATVFLGKNVVVGKEVHIGARTWIGGDGTVIIENGARIGDDEVITAPEGYVLVLKKDGKFVMHMENNVKFLRQA